jgi:hypothetical protein
MITSEFIHIHIPRTGGQQVRSLVDHSPVPVLDRSTHISLAEARSKLRRLMPDADPESVPAFCFVRNPWDWYVSRYFFRLQRDRTPGEEVVPADFCGGGVEGFRKHMRLLQKHVEADTPVPNEAGRPAMTRTYKPVMLSEWHAMLVGDAKPRIGRFENFSRDIADIIAPLSGMPHGRILSIVSARINSSRHKPYQAYYDDALRKLVAGWDAPYIEEFGYEF